MHGCFIFACLSFSSGLPLAAEGQQTKLRVTLQLPATDALLGKSLVRFKEDAEKQSNGAISVEIFDKGKLYIDDQTVGAVETGAIEMGVAGLNQFAKRIPAIDIMEQPFLFNFEELVRATASPDSEMRKLIDKTILDTVGVRVLWWQSVGNQIFISKGTTTTEPRPDQGSKDSRFQPDTCGVREAVRGYACHGVGQQDPRRPFSHATSKWPLAPAASSPIASCGRWPIPSRARCTRRSNSSLSSTRRSGSRFPRATGRSWRKRRGKRNRGAAKT